MWVYYFYYTCRQKECEMYGKSFNNHKVHDELEAILKSMKIDPSLHTAFEKVLEDVCNSDKEMQWATKQRNKQKIKEIDKSVNKLQDRILEASSGKVMELYEKKIDSLMLEKEALENEMHISDSIDKQVVLQTRQDAKAILENPAFVWELDHLELKRLMLNVLFDSELYYSTEGGLQTPSMSLIYCGLDEFTSSNTRMASPERIELPARGFGDLRSTTELWGFRAKKSNAY